ncbi:MFS transporter, partial [Streptomyces albidoflavus]|nr:MFS transporter [Streptomyces albidoflavus]
MDIADGLATSPHRPAPPGPEELAALRRRTTGVLVAGQILGGLGVAVG